MKVLNYFFFFYYSEILGVQGDVTQHPIALDGGGSQPPVAADIPTLDSAYVPIVQSKKRKPNATRI
jgi:hypothetical protein